MPISVFTRRERNTRRERRTQRHEQYQRKRQARRTVRGLEKLENCHAKHATASRVRAWFEQQGAQIERQWRPLAERLPTTPMIGGFVLLLTLVFVLDNHFIVAESVSLQGESFQAGWTAWLWVAAVGTVIYALLFYAKMHPVSEAAEAHVAATSESESRRTRNAWRKAWLAAVGYSAIVLFISGLSWHYEQVAKAEMERTRKEIRDTRALLANNAPVLAGPAATAAGPTPNVLPSVAERPEELPWKHALEWIAGFLFGGVRPWILAGHFLLLLWPCNLTAFAEPVTYEQALNREDKHSRAKGRAARAVRPLVFAAHDQREAGDPLLYDLIRGSLRPSTLTLLDELHNEPAAPIALATPAPEPPTAPPAPAPKNGPQPGTWSEPQPPQNGPQPEPLDPFEGLA
jgi:hypothetical protein